MSSRTVQSTATLTRPALTTVFTPPSRCRTGILTLQTETNTKGATVTQLYRNGPGGGTARSLRLDDDCLPERFNEYWGNPYEETEKFGYYSPAICPEQYTTCTSTTTEGELKAVMEYVAMCCPS